MAEITPGRIDHLKSEVLHECYRFAADLGLDLEGEAVRHGLFTPRQVRNAFDGIPPRVSLTRLVDFMFALREQYNFRPTDDGLIPDEPNLPLFEEDDDGIPW